MIKHRMLPSIIMVVVAFAHPVSLIAQTCRIVNLMPAFWTVVA